MKDILLEDLWGDHSEVLLCEEGVRIDWDRLKSLCRLVRLEDLPLGLLGTFSMGSSS